MQAISQEESFRLFVDKWRSPIWVENLADVLLELATQKAPAILHIGGPERLSQWELGMELLDHFGITPTPKIQKGTIEESGLVRPPNLTLDSSAAQQLLQTPVLPLSEARQKIQKSEP